jgi:hypothetical protein
MPTNEAKVAFPASKALERSAKVPDISRMAPIAKAFKPYGSPTRLDLDEFKDSFELWHAQWKIFLALLTIDTVLEVEDHPEYKTNILLSCLSKETLQTVLTMGFAALSRCIAETKECMTTNKLKLNEAKTDCLLVFSDSSRVKPISMPLMVGSSPVLPSTSVLYLGAGLDSKLSMEAQILATRKKALFHLSRISRMKRFLSKPALAQLLHAFVLSTLDYNNSLLVGCPESKLCVLQKVQNLAARFAIGCNRRDHITPYLKSLHWLPVRQRIDFKISLLMFNCLNVTAPSYLTSFVTRYEPPSSLCRLSSRPELVVPKIKSKKYGYTSFSYAGPALWNSLPFSVRSSTTLAQFRSSLKTHLCRVAFEN